ncbi:hypothetical protein [Oligella urethralis]|uniref:hypothetical protein n=1 Tax=Oligella urethralis TaxID=90245 RepID=UPI0021ACC22D|nr:hypothetical protein [Oligella urethralis]
MKETTHGTEVRMQGNKPYFRKFEGLLQRSHIARDTEVTIEITAEEVAAIFWAYDRGINAMDEASMQKLDAVINKLKYELWP